MYERIEGERKRKGIDTQRGIALELDGGGGREDGILSLVNNSEICT